ncbi:hypothetical protein AEGHOMDF_2590 [Methylobacterium soli]|nr:hypothetical protein AEGHOMDF_2590 [Methylobacterium soli]
MGDAERAQGLGQGPAGERRFEEARDHEVGRHRPAQGRREGRPVEDRQGLQARPRDQGRPEAGDEAAQVPRRHEAEDALPRPDPGRDEVDGGRGEQRVAGAVHRPGRIAAREADEAAAGIADDRGGAPVEGHLVEIDHAVRHVGAEGREVAQAEIARGDAAQALGRPVRPEPRLGQDGADPRRLDAGQELLRVPGLRQQAGDVAGRLDGEMGDEGLGAAGQRQTDAAAGGQAPGAQAVAEAGHELGRRPVGPGHRGAPAPGGLVGGVHQGDAGGMADRGRGQEGAEPRPPQGNLRLGSPARPGRILRGGVRARQLLARRLLARRIGRRRGKRRGQGVARQGMARQGLGERPGGGWRGLRGLVAERSVRRLGRHWHPSPRCPSVDETLRLTTP